MLLLFLFVSSWFNVCEFVWCLCVCVFVLLLFRFFAFELWANFGKKVFVWLHLVVIVFLWVLIGLMCACVLLFVLFNVVIGWLKLFCLFHRLLVV